MTNYRPSQLLTVFPRYSRKLRSPIKPIAAHKEITFTERYDLKVVYLVSKVLQKATQFRLKQ
jgi:hypothetical protein